MMPEVEGAVESSSLGRDALKKAQDSVARAREALGSASYNELTTNCESLDRTIAVFKGIIERAG